MNTEREAFENWLNTTSWKDDSLTFHNDLFQAWQAAIANKPEAESVGTAMLSVVDERFTVATFNIEIVPSGAKLYTAPPSAAALQKRIEELEAVAANTRNEALEQATKIVEAEQLGEFDSISTALAAKIRALKAGDVQAPKECRCPEHGTWIEATGYYKHCRELDVALNGAENAAQQPLLIDLLSQIEGIVRKTGKPILEQYYTAAPTDTEGK